MAEWAEIAQAGKENRHELVLTGTEISQRLGNHGLDETLFKLRSLNFLEISKTCLKSFPDKCSELTDLTNLVLFHNKLTEVPEGLGSLHKLKFLDLSQNEIEAIPEGVFKLGVLQSLNLSGNKLTELPSIDGLKMLHIFNVSQNQLHALPDGITSEELVHLAEIKANGNVITELPDDFPQLPALKTLDVSENNIIHMPSTLSECVKMKEFMFGGNKLKDRRLMKMGQQCTTKSVLDYLRGILEKERKESGKGKGGKKGKGKKKHEPVPVVHANVIKVLPFQEEGGIIITYNPEASNVRGYLVVCTVSNLNFSKDSGLFKRFISLQTKLHDTICNKRQVATIATHDLGAIKSPLSYQCRLPDEMMLRPLHKAKDVSAKKLVAKLMQEAEEMRKEKKRSTVSGIHKYLDLLKDKKEYPCLVDTSGTVISFPPITNCDSTKMTSESKGLLIEVTSSTNLDICKQVMTELLKNMLEMGIDEGGDEGAGAGGGKTLVVGQVKVVDADGSLRVVFPSRVDLVSDSFSVLR